MTNPTIVVMAWPRAPITHFTSLSSADRQSDTNHLPATLRPAWEDWVRRAGDRGPAAASGLPIFLAGDLNLQGQLSCHQHQQPSRAGDCSSSGCLLMEGAMSSSPNSRIALVTGGNKGIGLEVCKQLGSNGITVVLTARDQARGTAAVQELKRLGFSDVIFHQLDITDALSIARLVDFLKNRFERLDILLNNAAIGGTERPPLCGSMPVDKKVQQFDGMDKNQRLEWLFKNCRETYQATKQCLETNYYGTKQVTEALLPLLQRSPDGRIVNVSSSVGLLRQFRNEELTQELNDIDQLTEKRLDDLLDMFLKDFEAGRVQVRGWPAEFPAYKVAKAAMNAYSRILARRHPALCVNCADPGFTSTDMTLNTGLLTPEEGARNIVKVALLPDGDLTGAYFQEGQQASFL